MNRWHMIDLLLKKNKQELREIERPIPYPTFLSSSQYENLKS